PPTQPYNRRSPSHNPLSHTIVGNKTKPRYVVIPNVNAPHTTQIIPLSTFHSSHRHTLGAFGAADESRARMWRVGCRARDLRWFVYGCLGWYRCLDLVSVLSWGW